MAHDDRSPWGPAAIAAVFALIAVGTLARFPDAPGTWLVVLLCGLVVAWYVRQAVLRHLERE